MSIVQLLVIIFSILSIISLLTIIIAFLFFSQKNNPKFELVFYLSLASLVATITYIMNWEENVENKADTTATTPPICLIQGTLMTISEISLYFWTSIIGYDVYKKVVKNEDLTLSSGKRRIIYLIIGFLVPTVFGIVCLTTGIINKSGYYCWIIGNNTFGATMQMVAFGMGYLANGLNAFYAYSIVKMFYFEGVAKELGHHLSKGVVWKMIRYPVIQIISYIPPTINRIIELFESTKDEAEKGNHTKILAQIGIVLMSLLGFLITIAYSINTGTLFCIKNIFSGEREKTIRISNDLLGASDTEHDNDDSQHIELES